jgi:hypothetical protein
MLSSAVNLHFVYRSSGTELCPNSVSVYEIRDCPTRVVHAWAPVIQNQYPDSSETFNGGVIMNFPDTSWVRHLGKLTCYLRSQVLTAEIMKGFVFWDILMCNLLNVNWCLGRTLAYFLHEGFWNDCFLNSEDGGSIPFQNYVDVPRLLPSHCHNWLFSTLYLSKCSFGCWSLFSL